MSEEAILERIEQQTGRRRRAWERRDVAEAREAAERIEELYEELRAERTRARGGDRETITKRARIALELEKVAGG